MTMFVNEICLKLLMFKRLPFLRFHSTCIPIADFENQHKTPKCVKTTPVPLALYGGIHTVTMIPGNGIGPELMEYVKHIFKVAKAPVHFETVQIDPNRKDNKELAYALTSIKRNGIAIKGNIDTLSDDTNVRLANVGIRNELDLYAYVMCCKSYPSVKARYPNINIVVIRQNTEGEYSMLEHSIKGGRVVENLKIITEENSMRVAKFAFDFARKNNRKKVTTIHKANIMKFSDGLFLKVARKVATEYADIKHDDMIIDNCCMQLVSNPQQFDVMLTPNLYGNIVANVICGLSGGPGLVSGRNYGDHFTVFEPGTRNSGTAIAKKNIANPIAMLNASVDMLYHLGHVKQAKVIEDAISKTITVDKILTPDVGGTASSSDVVAKIIQYI